MTDYTTNFNLEKYQTGDAANLNDQYNASMNIIDDNLYKINTNANTAGGKATQALETAQNNNKNLTALGVTDTTTAAALKNTIDGTKTTADTALTNTQTNENNIASINANLNALGANTVNDATTLKNKVNTNTTNIANINEKFYPHFNKIVSVGDSITYGTGTTNPSTDNWVQQLAKLCGNSIVKNYAQNNAGFVATGAGAPGMTFLQMLQAAKNNDSDADCIIIAGGINDGEQSNVGTAATNTIKYACDNWPHAKIYYIPDPIAGCLGYASFGVKNLQRLGELVQAGIGLRATTIKYAWEWLNPYAISTDEIHPNNEGAIKFANYVYAAMQGSIPRASLNAQKITLAPGITAKTNNMWVSIVDGWCQINGIVTLSTNVTAFHRVFNLPKGFDYSNYMSGMKSDADNTKNLFYPDSAYEPNTIMSYDNIPSGKAIYANCKYQIGVSVMH